MSNKVEYKSCRTQDHGDQKNTRPQWSLRTQDHGE